MASKAAVLLGMRGHRCSCIMPAACCDAAPCSTLRLCGLLLVGGGVCTVWRVLVRHARRRPLWGGRTGWQRSAVSTPVRPSKLCTVVVFHWARILEESACRHVQLQLGWLLEAGRQSVEESMLVSL